MTHITRITAKKVAIPTKHKMLWGGGSYTGLNAVVVRLETDDGLVGYGECDARIGGVPEAVQAIVLGFGSRLVGISPFDIEAVRRAFFVGEHWHFAGVFPNLAFAGIEMALWDLIGKSLNQPVCNLLGGRLRPSINHFGYVLKRPIDEMAAQALAFKKGGYTVLYTKIGYGRTEDERILSAIRDAVGGEMRIRIDIACEWDVPETINAMRRLEKFDLEFLEQPVGRFDLDGHREIKNRCGVPVALNQSVWSGHDVMEVIKRRAADVIVIGPAWCGGLGEFKKIAYLLELEGMPLCRYGCETSLGLAASLQVCATIPNLMDGSQIYIDQLRRDVVARPLVLDGPNITVPSDSGLGIDVDEHLLDELSRCYESAGPFHRQERLEDA